MVAYRMWSRPVDSDATIIETAIRGACLQSGHVGSEELGSVRNVLPTANGITIAERVLEYTIVENVGLSAAEIVVTDCARRGTVDHNAAVHL